MVYKHICDRGAGGFGTVAEVVDDNGGHYARKTLVVPNGADGSDVKRRFSREVRFQRTIKHPNVVSVLDEDLAANPPWFVMPLAEESLDDEMKRDRQLGGSPHVALYNVLAGLEEIHRKGFCHRDLKPANILKFRTAQGSPFYAVSDFGLMAVGEEASSTLTPSGAGGGTIHYQAPECVNNFKRATPRSDIYSFGAILFDVFVGGRRLPHIELAGPGAIGPVIEKCTKTNQHRRYKNVAELRESLFNVLNDYQFTYESGAEQKAIAPLLATDQLPTPDEWDKLFDYLDENGGKAQVEANVFQALRLEHVLALSDEDPGLLSGLGKIFSNYCRSSAFNFDYCDVLAAKGQAFYDLGDPGLKAEIAVAMLRLGTSHNRWFVERKFLMMAGPAISEALAERIAAELSVADVDLKKEFAHLSISISATPEQLHPVLRALLEK